MIEVLGILFHAAIAAGISAKARAKGARGWNLAAMALAAFVVTALFGSVFMPLLMTDQVDVLIQYWQAAFLGSVVGLFWQGHLGQQ